MKEDNLVDYRNPGVALPVADALTEVLRRGGKLMVQVTSRCGSIRQEMAEGTGLEPA